MKLKDLLAKLNELVTADKTNEEKDAVDVIHTAAPSEVFQVIFDRGHSTGLQKGKTNTTELEGKVTAAETAKAEAERQLNEFKAKHPDAAKLQEGYQNDLKKKDEEHAEALRKKDELIEKERRGRARSDLITELTGLGVEKIYAEVLADRPENVVRIKFDKEGQPEVLQKGKDIAIVPTAEKGPLGMLAVELKATTPAKFLTSNAKGGGGLQPETGGDGEGKKTVFQNIRKTEQERQKSTVTGGASTAAARLGGRRPEPSTTTK